jgi:hypothetical protein
MARELCWFCKKAVSEPAAACQTPMYGNVRTDIIWDSGGRQRRTRWNKTSIEVPRCPACKAVHVRQGKKAKFGCLGIGLFGLALFVLFGVIGALKQNDSPVTAIAVSIFLFVLSAPPILVWRREAARDKAERLALGIEAPLFRKQYPQVSTLLKAGWKIGEKF